MSKFTNRVSLKDKQSNKLVANPSEDKIHDITEDNVQFRDGFANFNGNYAMDENYDDGRDSNINMVYLITNR